MFADVAFPQRRYQVFTYRIPARLEGQLQVGSRVLVPLGRSSAQGLVFKLSQTFTSQSVREGFSPYDLREISALVDAPTDSPIDPILIKLARQVGDYYVSPPGAALRLILPPIASRRIAKRLILTDLGKHALGRSRLSADQSTVLARLAKAPKGLTAATLLKAIDGNKSVMAGLIRRGLVQEVEWVRAAPEKASVPQVGRSDLTDSLLDQGADIGQLGEEESFSNKQSPWLNRVYTALSTQRYDEVLLTASQSVRERCLFDAIHETFFLKRKVLVLCPEVQQVSRIVEVLRQAWGNRVNEYHSDLSAQVRSRYWRDIQEGRCDVVVGTRLAVFVPLPSVGLIWVDQEEDTSFQEEQSPYYHAREVARMRATLEPAILILGSSHPSIETMHTLGHDDEAYALQKESLNNPVDVEVVNLQQVPYGTILSDRMVEGMQTALEAKGRIVLFLNRKGFSRSLTCQDCGYVPQCTKCGVTLILYQKPARMKCSYCGYVHVPPVVCPSCQSVRLEAMGYGTERLEAIVREKFPHATVARFDRETVKTPVQETAILQEFSKREIDILIGTELLFHALSLPPVQFLGIPNADGGLHFPDFRSAERTYHRLMEAVQVVDKEIAGPPIVLQTLLPTHHVIRSVAQQDPHVFYREELKIREALNYPPYSLLIHIAISGKIPEHVKKMAMHCRARLLAEDSPQTRDASHSKHTAEGSDNILGPLLSSRANSPGVTRYVLIVKDTDGERAQSLVKRMQEDLAASLKRERLMMEVKVNPADMH